MSRPDRSRWEEVERLFDEAQARPPAERGAWLARACAGDTGLLAEVDSLLQASQASGDFLEARPTVPATAAPPPSLPAGTRVGPWAIDRPLGRGGMGEVYAAHRADGAFEQ